MKINDQLLLAVSGITVLLLTIGVARKESTDDWRMIQSEFMELARAKLGAERMGTIETGIVQIWNPELKLVDRCTTCHMAINIPGFEDEKEPFRTHPELAFWNKSHPFKDYGCTSCHGGQGYAVKVDDAHGKMKHWEYPLLDNQMAHDYGYQNSAELMQVNCNVCHRRDRTTARMALINQAKQLIADRPPGCTTCHIYDGFNGGSIGPELTFEGSKHGEAFDMSGVEGKHTVLQWHIEHFQAPGKVTKNSIMPPMAQNAAEARALGLLVMSWKNVNIPFKFLPDPARETTNQETPDK